MTRVLLLATGGTIAGRGADSASLNTYTAGALAGEELLAAVPPLQNLAETAVEQVANGVSRTERSGWSAAPVVGPIPRQVSVVSSVHTGAGSGAAAPTAQPVVAYRMRKKRRMWGD